MWHDKLHVNEISLVASLYSHKHVGWLENISERIWLNISTTDMGWKQWLLQLIYAMRLIWNFKAHVQKKYKKREYSKQTYLHKHHCHCLYGQEPLHGLICRIWEACQVLLVNPKIIYIAQVPLGGFRWLQYIIQIYMTIQKSTWMYVIDRGKNVILKLHKSVSMALLSHFRHYMHEAKSLY